MDRPDGSDKAAAIFGAIAVALYLIAFSLVPPHAPSSASPGAEIVRYATAHRARLLGSDLFLALAVASLMVYAGALHQILRRGERRGGWLAMASLASVVFGASVFSAGSVLFMAVAYRPATDPAVARAFWDAGWLAYNVTGFAFGAWMALVAAAALRDRALPTWTAWVGIGSAVVTVAGPLAVKVGTGPFSPQGWFAVVVALTFAVWMLAISAAAWAQRRAGAAVAPVGI